jgi:tricarballylate dehydrogenase
VTGGLTDEHLARLVIRASSTCRDWMRGHGVRFQPPLSGALHVARTNAFFMGGGKALVNAYYRSAERLGVQIRYDTPVDSVELDGGASRRGAPKPANASKRRAACSPPAASSRTASGCARPGARTSAASGRPTTS